MTISARRLLVVDDDHDFAESLADLLELSGYEVEVVHDFRWVSIGICFSEEAVPLVNAVQATVLPKFIEIPEVMDMLLSPAYCSSIFCVNLFLPLRISNITIS